MGLFIINRRRKYFIDKSFQLKFIVKFCLIIIVASILIVVMAYFLNMQTTTIAFEDMRVVVKSTAEFIMPILFYILVIVTVFSAATVAAVALFTSHKIIGPLYRFKTGIERMREGDLTLSFTLRKDDQLKDVAADLEELRIKLTDSLRVIKDGWQKIKSSSSLGSSGKSSKKSAEIKKAIEDIDRELERFKYNS